MTDAPSSRSYPTPGPAGTPGPESPPDQGPLPRRARGAPALVVTGTSGTSMTADLAAWILAASGYRVSRGHSAGARRGLGQATADREVLTWDPTRGPLPVAPRVLALTGLHADELPAGVSRSDWAAPVSTAVASTGSAVAVNAADPVALGLAATARVAVHATAPVDPNPVASIRDGRIVLRDPAGQGLAIMALDDLGLISPAYRPHVLVAATAAILMGARADAAAAALAESAAHAGNGIDRLGSRRGVVWIGDPGAHRPGRALPSLAIDPHHTLLLAGGAYGGQPLGRWAAAAAGARYVLLYGSASDPMAKALSGAPAVVRCADLRDAVAAAGRLARRGDTVAFAPGCHPETGRIADDLESVARLSLCRAVSEAA